MKLHCKILTDAGHLHNRHSNGGLSATHTNCVLVFDEPEPSRSTDSRGTPYVYLETKNVGGDVYHYCRPVLEVEDRASYGKDKTPFMMGGAFVYTSDSRRPNKYPLPLHDRRESWKQYDMLSR